MIELTPLLNKQLKTPLYIQLYEYIKKEIETGGIPTGALLPPIRYLCEHLHLSKNTVESAYQQLTAEGYTESRPRIGIKVLPLEKTLIPPGQLKIHTNREPKETGQATAATYDFKYGDIDLSHFPFKTWRRCLQNAMDSGDHELLLYGHHKGDFGLRTELAKYLFQARGVRCAPEQIVICSGTQYAVGLLCQLLSMNGRLVAAENPGYDGVRSVFLNHGCDIQPIGLETDGVNLSQLAATGAKLVYITPSHQFPYGMVLPIQKRLKLLEWASRENAYIIEDDYDSEFRYQGRPIPSLKALDKKENVIYLGTFSKSFLPGARLSYIVLPSKLADEFQEKLGRYSQSASPIIQKAMFLFMKEGFFERHIRKMKKVYQEKHKTLISAIKTHFGNEVEIIGEKAGLHILMKTGRDAQVLIHQAKKLGVKVYPVSDFWLEPHESSSSIVMAGFGGLSAVEIEEGISRLRKAWLSSSKQEQ
ncbi:HTH-type transcriptional regulatory protein GabR [Bacillus paralicheniformis]|uniref:MocR-like pyridoxine biosynthesis transcription factor PdxR n=1 Tax=Bacillus paralicheniformis TaxID=1648923 RepID=UPI0013535A0D|nr:PLP-dependent aminotransferase family protein [Bacillus paralicheniformis]TWM24829.1 HTH-type transcriptional regulatory protein GabR [Bacillus paralicheniformis]